MPNLGVSEIVRAALAAPARLGGARLVLIDGPAGAGKTSLASRVASELVASGLVATVVHGDDLYEGWTGLGTLWATLGPLVIEPLSRGEDATFDRWDWTAERRGERCVVPWVDAVVIEGVGVAQRRVRPFASLVVYVDAPWPERLRRGIARDGEDMESAWERWHRDEDAHFATEGTRAAADVVIDGLERVPD